LKKIEDILALCIKDIKAGSSTLSDCLDRYAYMRRELEPLLRIALSIQEPPPVQSSNAFRVRARVQLMEQIHALKSESKSRRYFFGSGIRQTWYAGLLKTVAIIAAIVIAVSALGAGTAYASQDSLPGDTLYPVKLGTEQVRSLLTIDDIAGVELELTFAGIRLQEIEALANKAPDRTTIAVMGYERNIAMAIEKAERAQDNGVSEMVALAISKHLSLLERVEGDIPEAAKEAIKQAKEIVISRQFMALRALARKNPVRAAEINIDTMQSRLNRARVKAEEGEFVEVEEALRQFEELHRFGEEISKIAKGLGYGTTAVDGLNTRATSAQLEVLGIIYGKVPEEAKRAVEEAMGVSVEGYGQAVKRLLERGALNDIPEEPPIPDEIPGKQERGALNDIPEEPPIPDEIPGKQERGALNDIPEEPPIPDEIPEKGGEKVSEPEPKGSGNGRR